MSGYSCNQEYDGWPRLSRSTVYLFLVVLCNCAFAQNGQGIQRAQEASTASPSSALERIKRGEPLRLGYRTNSPPLSFGKDGRAQGYTVDLCRAAIALVAKQLPRQLQSQRREIAIVYLPVTLENRMSKVASGEIDLECGLTSNTASRAKVVDFSPMVLVTGTKIAVGANSSLQSLQELAGRDVAAGKGTTNLRSLNRYAKERGFKFNLIETTDTKAAFTAVSQGKVVGAALNEISALGWSHEQPDTAVRLLERYLSTEAVAISLPKHDPAFVRAFNGALSEVLIGGEAERIYQRWLGRAGLGLPLNQLTREAFRVPIIYSVADELL